MRQLLTESVLLAVLSGAAGIAFAMAGIRVLTQLLANGQEGFTLHAELNWNVLLVTLGLRCCAACCSGLRLRFNRAVPRCCRRSRTMARTRASGRSARDEGAA